MMRRMNRKFRNLLATGRLPGFGREGFTLIEIMMVLMILSLGVLPIAVIQHRSRHEVMEADRHTQGIQVAKMHRNGSRVLDSATRRTRGARRATLPGLQ